MRSSIGEEPIELVPSLEGPYRRLTDRVGGEDLIFIIGPPATGKTTLVMKLFSENREYLHAYINCYEISTPTQLYSTIYRSFFAGIKSRTQKLPRFEDIKIKASDFPVYFRELNRLAQEQNHEKLYVTLDQIELFRRTPLVDCVTLFSTIEDFNMIMISNEPPQDIIHCLGGSQENMLTLQDKIVPVSVPCWSREDLIHAIMEYPPLRGEDLYKKFVNNVVQSNNSSRNFHEVKLYCQNKFPKFLAEYEKLRQENLIVQLRKEPGSQFKNKEDSEIIKWISENKNEVEISGQLNKRCFAISSANILKAKSSLISVSDARIPTTSSILIVAAFIASQTTPADDKRNFVKKQAKKARQVSRSKGNVSRPFTLERLLHVYSGLLRAALEGYDEKMDGYMYKNDSVLSDVERLENLNLFQLCSGDGISSESRYRLSKSVKREYIDELAERQSIKLEYIQGLNW